MIWLYRITLALLSPVILLWIALRVLKGKESRSRVWERFGLAQGKPVGAPVVWLHGASVGETLSILPLIEELLKNKDLHILVTSGTTTSAELMAKHLPKLDESRTHHRFAPLDFWPCIKLFLNHWKPKLSVFVESEWWPEMLHQAPNPVLINARISDRSFPRYQKHFALIKPFVSRFKTLHAQSEHDLERLHALGLTHAELGGNLKFDSKPLHFEQKELTSLQKSIGKRPIVLAASTHPGEEDMLIKLYPELEKALPNLCLIIAPRHPHRGEELLPEFKASGLNVKRRSIGESVDTKTQIYLADTLGEMGMFYTLSDAVLIGGSFVPHGGHNPIEPLQLGTPVICGPHMFNFKFIMQILLEKNLIVQLDQAAEIPSTLGKCTDQNTVPADLSELTGATDKARQIIENALKA